jgi:hypothetical protein
MRSKADTHSEEAEKAVRDVTPSHGLFCVCGCCGGFVS